ncbi:MAG: hydroxymethylbilane synthase [Planctomyces sp.]|nr:hydroxymethylbilane synthase [Planctomyces sp.]
MASVAIPPLRIATRSSALAVWQAEHLAAALLAARPASRIELVPITTQGDRDRSNALSQMGGVGVFTREVQEALLDGRADVAVHSLKDLPTDPVAGLQLGAVLPRAPRCDVLLLPQGRPCQSLDDLLREARVGTGSLRRQAQLRSRRPDLRLRDIRGNLDTRLRKLDDGEFDAIILAEAGLRRLGLADRISLLLEPPLMYPAVGQGAIGVECRDTDEASRSWLAEVDDAATHCEALAERACLAELRAGCHAPVGVWSRLEPAGPPTPTTVLHFEAAVWSLDGRERIGVTLADRADDPEAVGREASRLLRGAGAGRLVEGQSVTGDENA